MTIPTYNTKIIPLYTDPKSQNFERRGIATTSIPLINKALGGFEKGELIIITAPPGQGKTQLARTFCLDFIKQGLNCVYLSFELRYNQLLGMFIQAGLGDMGEKLEILKPEIETEQDITFVEQLCKGKFDVLVVDDLQALEEKYATYRHTDNMALVLRGLAQRLKDIARNTDKIVMTMVHTRKDAINSRETSLADIAYSGGIAQVADTVLSIKTDKDGYAIIEITKARYSGGRIKVKCQSVNKKFIELSEYNEPNPAKLVNSLYN